MPFTHISLPSMGSWPTKNKSSTPVRSRQTSVDLSKVSASYEGGVLTLVVPRSESARPRQITVSTGRPSEGSADIQAQPQEQGQDAQYA